MTPAPNIVIILADDMGYGDPRCLNPDSLIPTPNLDRFADLPAEAERLLGRLDAGRNAPRNAP